MVKFNVSLKLIKQNKLYGTTTVGSRGQIVIPAKARSELDIKPGDQLMVVTKMGKVLSMIKVDKIADIINMATTMMGNSEGEKTVKEYVESTFGKAGAKKGK